MKIINLEREVDYKRSIFLRYWPLPLIKKACVEELNDDMEYLDLFKQVSYEKANLIWNGEMREIMKDQILQNSRQLINDLLHFSRLREKQDDQLREKQDEFFWVEVPEYSKPLQRVIKYKFIEEEVRCGKYYLRVWIQKKKTDEDFFLIPQSEEDDFLNNLKASISKIIYQDGAQTPNQEDLDSERRRLLILLKACLLALGNFKNKRILCL